MIRVYQAGSPCGFVSSLSGYKTWPAWLWRDMLVDAYATQPWEDVGSLGSERILWGAFALQPAREQKHSNKVLATPHVSDINASNQ